MAKKEALWQKFVFGGVSAMAATAVVQPVDLVKNRMQMSGVGVTTKLVSRIYNERKEKKKKK